MAQAVSATTTMSRVRGILLDAAGEFQAIHAGQLDVDQHQVGVQRAQHLQRLLGIAGGVNLVTFFTQE
jgi:hypothetical protein